MRTIKKRVSKAFLFTCLGLLVATIAFARIFDRPDPPGRPSAYDIEAIWAKLMFKKPSSDGGASIQYYRVEYKAKSSPKWQLETNVDPQYGVNNKVECTVNNRVGKEEVAFRAFAANSNGLSAPSSPSDHITFRDPFE